LRIWCNGNNARLKFSLPSHSKLHLRLTKWDFPAWEHQLWATGSAQLSICLPHPVNPFLPHGSPAGGFLSVSIRSMLRAWTSFPSLNPIP
jgi:hypothetical protein